LLHLYDYDLTEHIICVNDWINSTALTKFLNYVYSDGNNYPDSLLINGKGAFHIFSTNNSDRTYQTQRAEFIVKQGFRYRFRVINSGFLYCPIQISVDQHNLTIIATDGYSVDPVEIQNFVIYAGEYSILKVLYCICVYLHFNKFFNKQGERYDFILNATQRVGNYLIRAKGLANCNASSVFETAVLRYAYANGNLLNIDPKMFNNLNYTNLIQSGLVINLENII